MNLVVTIQYMKRQSNVHVTKCVRRNQTSYKDNPHHKETKQPSPTFDVSKSNMARNDRMTGKYHLKTPVLAVAVVIRCLEVARARTSWLFRRKNRLDAQALLCFWRVALQSIGRTAVRDSSQVRRSRRPRRGTLAMSFPSS